MIIYLNNLKLKKIIILICIFANVIFKLLPLLSPFLDELDGRLFKGWIHCGLPATTWSFPPTHFVLLLLLLLLLTGTCVLTRSG